MLGGNGKGRRFSRFPKPGKSKLVESLISMGCGTLLSRGLLSQKSVKLPKTPQNGIEIWAIFVVPLIESLLLRRMAVLKGCFVAGGGRREGLSYCFTF